ncbi:hypothetical protein F544_13050 [Bibersteinia trehalosi USDA-ARS-USMARC-190]|uniref:Uncharacterized protein n=1 Tax=Bibersteinia trehalosi USDA-ARS-USMARC-190 TaxID=1263832 RepID=W0RAW4_BIBTR|nr:hypothetical protein F544_13050 [Bibersteinia trehalosi USDA-ARS-USMARC-190]
MKTKIAGDPAIPYKFAAKSRVRILIKFAKKSKLFCKKSPIFTRLLVC